MSGIERRVKIDTGMIVAGGEGTSLCQTASTLKSEKSSRALGFKMSKI